MDWPLLGLRNPMVVDAQAALAMPVTADILESNYEILAAILCCMPSQVPAKSDLLKALQEWYPANGLALTTAMADTCALTRMLGKVPALACLLPHAYLKPTVGKTAV